MLSGLKLDLVGSVDCLNTNHTLVVFITEVANGCSLLNPRVPDYRIAQVCLKKNVASIQLFFNHFLSSVT